MSKVCELCGKGPVAGHNVSHSQRKTKRRFLPNLVSKKFGGVKRKICTSCLRTLKKPEREKKLTEKKPAEEVTEKAEVVEEKATKKVAKPKKSSSKK